MFSRKECKKAALASLKGRWKTPVLSVLAIYVFGLILAGFYLSNFLGLQNIDETYDPKVILGFLGGFFLFFILYFGSMVCIVPAITMGYKKVFVTLCNTTEPVPFKELFGGFSKYGRSMGAFWWNYLWIWLWTLAFYFPTVISIGVMVVCFVTSSTAVTAKIVSATVFVIFFIAMIAFICYKSISYSMLWYILCDDSSVGVIDAMNISKAITKNNCWKLFVLDFSFIGWILLGMLTLGIGYLWLIPYMETAQYQAYKVLRDNYYANKTVEEPKQIENKIEPVNKTEE